MEGRSATVALFNLAIDSKLRGCDVVALKVDDIAPSGHAVDRARSAELGWPAPAIRRDVKGWEGEQMQTGDPTITTTHLCHSIVIECGFLTET